jgi:hypothetical protein
MAGRAFGSDIFDTLSEFLSQGLVLAHQCCKSKCLGTPQNLLECFYPEEFSSPYTVRSQVLVENEFSRQSCDTNKDRVVEQDGLFDIGRMPASEAQSSDTPTLRTL